MKKAGMRAGIQIDNPFLEGNLSVYTKTLKIKTIKVLTLQFLFKELTISRLLDKRMKM